MKEYIVYQCRTCKKHFFLLAEEVEYSEKESDYITCPYHGKHKDIIVVGAYDDMQKMCREMNRKDTYKKKSGKVVQKGWGVSV